MMLNILKCTGWPTSKNHLTQNVSNAEIKKLVNTMLSRKRNSHCSQATHYLHKYVKILIYFNDVAPKIFSTTCH